MSATQAAGGRGRVLEELQADVVGREALGHDPRADHHRDQESGADGLGGDLPAEGRGHELSSRAVAGPLHGGLRRPSRLIVWPSAARASGAEPVVGPVAVALALDEADVAEHAEVVAHERLGHVERLDQMAHAQLLDGEQLQDAPPHRLRDRLQQLGVGLATTSVVIDMDLG